MSREKNRFKPQDLEVVNGDPFLHDKLNRRQEIENLSHLLVNSKGPLVLSIEAAWGSGKTAFMKMWREHLVNEFPDCISIYFSAWETDFSDDPLFVFLGEVNEQLASKTSGMTRDKWDKAINLAGRITKQTLPALVKILTYGALDFKESGIERTFAELAGGLATDTLEMYKLSVSAIQQFKENLTGVLRDTGKGAPVIIFIDELDRCRPQYTIVFLERIKHLLNLPDLIFILGIDRIQLANAIRGVYGQSFDAEIYLQRFIDLDYRLSAGNLNDFIKGLITTYDLESFFQARNAAAPPLMRNELNDLGDMCADIANLFSLSLREIEQLLARVNIVARSTKPAQPLFPHLLVGLLVLRSKATALYLELMNKKCTSKEIMAWIIERYVNAKEDSVDNIGKMTAFMIMALTDNQIRDSGIVELSNIKSDVRYRNEAERRLMISIAENYDSISTKYRLAIDLQSLKNRIEMAQKFIV